MNKEYTLPFAPNSSMMEELQKMMGTINQEGKKEIHKSQKDAYKHLYKQLVPILRLFYSLKNNKKLIHESILNQFKTIFLFYKEKDLKLQKKFNNPEEQSFEVRNRVSEIILLIVDH
jgi:hypothetical protein